MDEIESTTLSFVVRIWLEDDAGRPDCCWWRGHVTRVSGGEREYVDDLDEIAQFIRPFLEEAARKQPR